MTKLPVVTLDQSAVTPARAALTPARARLADHIKKVNKAEAELARARAPADRLRFLLGVAEAALRNAQARRDEADRRAAATLTRGATDGNADAVQSVTSGRMRISEARAVMQSFVQDMPTNGAMHGLMGIPMPPAVIETKFERQQREMFQKLRAGGLHVAEKGR